MSKQKKRRFNISITEREHATILAARPRTSARCAGLSGRLPFWGRQSAGYGCRPADYRQALARKHSGNLEDSPHTPKPIPARPS